MTLRERWLPVPNYEDIYSISDLGRVRVDTPRNPGRRGTMLAQSSARDGYLTVSLRYDHEKRARQFAVSRLVLRAFVGEPPNPRDQANHRNGDILDNRLENLEWCSITENIRHSIEVLGHTRAGERNPSAKLTRKKVVDLRKRAARGEAYRSLGKRFGVSAVMACSIARGKTWKDVGGPISGPRPLGRRKQA